MPIHIKGAGGVHPSGTIFIETIYAHYVKEYEYAQVYDANLTAGNIKKGVSILGVDGTFRYTEFFYPEVHTTGNYNTVLFDNPGITSLDELVGISGRIWGVGGRNWYISKDISSNNVVVTDVSSDEVYAVSYGSLSLETNGISLTCNKDIFEGAFISPTMVRFFVYR